MNLGKKQQTFTYKNNDMELCHIVVFFVLISQRMVFTGIKEKLYFSQLPSIHRLQHRGYRLCLGRIYAILGV